MRRFAPYFLCGVPLFFYKHNETKLALGDSHFFVATDCRSSTTVARSTLVMIFFCGGRNCVCVSVGIL